MTTRTRCNLNFFRAFSKNRHPGKLHCTLYSPEKLALLALLKEVQPSPHRKMIKLLTFDDLFQPLQHSRENSRENS